MEDLLIRHCTSYRYQVPVQLAPHRLMLRPRESCGVRLKTFDINILPQAQAIPAAVPSPLKPPLKGVTVGGQYARQRSVNGRKQVFLGTCKAVG